EIPRSGEPVVACTSAADTSVSALIASASGASTIDASASTASATASASGDNMGDGGSVSGSVELSTADGSGVGGGDDVSQVKAKGKVGRKLKGGGSATAKAHKARVASSLAPLKARNAGTPRKALGRSRSRSAAATGGRASDGHAEMVAESIAGSTEEAAGEIPRPGDPTDACASAFGTSVSDVFASDSDASTSNASSPACANVSVSPSACGDGGGGNESGSVSCSGLVDSSGDGSGGGGGDGGSQMKAKAGGSATATAPKVSSSLAPLKARDAGAPRKALGRSRSRSRSAAVVVGRGSDGHAGLAAGGTQEAAREIPRSGDTTGACASAPPTSVFSLFASASGVFTSTASAPAAACTNVSVS
ncbi:unnamed protein product, partial [Laminaria digitata]